MNFDERRQGSGVPRLRSPTGFRTSFNRPDTIVLLEQLDENVICRVLRSTWIERQARFEFRIATASTHVQLTRILEQLHNKGDGRDPAIHEPQI